MSRRPRASGELGSRPLALRIIGGRFRGRRLDYSGDPRTRPMKDRVREALFDWLGPLPASCQAFDLFAGTGALGLEALSRGARLAWFVEPHFPTAAVLRGNVARLGLEAASHVLTTSAFVWMRHVARQLPGGERAAAGQGGVWPVPDRLSPWLVFVSPPYDFYVDRAADMQELLAGLVELAPAESVLAVEADQRFDVGILPAAEEWQTRRYAPALLGLLRCRAG
jgi:16S rRNA G966 N2-methylase RsmD